MRIISFNANGIRSAARKGFFDWLAGIEADVVCIQETKAQEHQLSPHPEFFPDGYCCLYEDATTRKGYSGVAIYSRTTPQATYNGFGSAEFDPEGRYVAMDLGQLLVVSLYLPSGSSGDERQAAKYRHMDEFRPHMAGLRAANKPVVICGDWNIVRGEKDIKNWKSNQKNSGCLPEERAWMNGLIDEDGWIDAFRVLHPDATGEAYTWWSNRGKAYANNVGWRIDYQIATPDLKDKVRAAWVYKGQKFSDHAPLVVDYEL